jgi:putative ABC transport system ATP-binding protein
MMLYEACRLSYRYRLNGHHVEALRGVDLVIKSGEFVALAGPSGSGKTTLLNLLGLLDYPCHGSIRFEERNVLELVERERTLVRRERIAFIFQNLNLIPVLTAYENVEYFLLKRKLCKAEVQRRTLEALETVDIAAQSNQRPNHMSVGQRQRVAIARALVREPAVVLADEPTAALDQTTGLAVVNVMKTLNRQRGVTFIFTSHDPTILATADRVIQLVDGRTLE